MTQEQPTPPLPWPLKAFIMLWLGSILLAAFNHNILPNVIGRFDVPQLPHLRYGYVMFNKSPSSIPIVSYQPFRDVNWYHISGLVNTPAPFYKRARVITDVMFTGFDYMLALCAREQAASEAMFRVTYYEPGNTEQVREDLYLCRDHRLYPQ